MTGTVAADTLKNDSGWILHHVMDSKTIDFAPFGAIHIPQFPLIFGIDLTPTKHVIFMWITALVLILTMVAVTRSYKKSLIPGKFSGFFEILIVFVRDEIAKLTIGRGYEKFVPYLLTVFFFILFGNFLGLIPYSATFTSNIAVTSALAVFTSRPFFAGVGFFKLPVFQELIDMSAQWRYTGNERPEVFRRESGADCRWPACGYD